MYPRNTPKSVAGVLPGCACRCRQCSIKLSLFGPLQALLRPTSALFLAVVWCSAFCVKAPNRPQILHANRPEPPPIFQPAIHLLLSTTMGLNRGVLPIV